MAIRRMLRSGPDALFVKHALVTGWPFGELLFLRALESR